LFANNKYVEVIGIRGKKWYREKRRGTVGPETEGLKEKEKPRRS